MTTRRKERLVRAAVLVTSTAVTSTAVMSTASAQDDGGSGDTDDTGGPTVEQVSPGSTTTVVVPGDYGQPSPFLP
ncbi:MAG: hypothetical protein KC731_30345, partial [Myxococcales bacterium]|nr:hypothetical protein [Myxococcales bacterium]